MTLLGVLDLAGVAVFAATGALAASRKQLDVIGFVFLACITGVGGGTFRDLVLGAVPVFWVRQPMYLGVCLATALVVFATAHLVESRYRVLLWLDAIGLSLFCAMGAAVGLEMTGSAGIAIVTGIASATFGGILRDVLAEEQSVLLRPEIYVTAAAAGATVYTLAMALGAPAGSAAIAAMAVALTIRGGALIHGWTLPRYRAPCRADRGRVAARRDRLDPAR